MATLQGNPSLQIPNVFKMLDHMGQHEGEGFWYQLGALVLESNAEVSSVSPTICSLLPKFDGVFNMAL